MSGRPWFPFARLAAQNVARRPGRALVLASAVAVAVGAGFASLVARQAVSEGVESGVGRLGADLLVVPRDALVNLTPSLLTGEAGPRTLDPGAADEVAALPGVAAAAPHRCVRLDDPVHGPGHGPELIVFDPARDFTVLPWLRDRPGRPFGDGDVLVGGRRPEAPGATVTLAGKALTVYGRLGLTGVGPFDRAYFVGRATAGGLVADPDRASAVLVRVAAGSRPERVRFALAGSPAWKVVGGPPAVASVRDALAAVLGAAAGLTGVVLLAAVFQVAALYSAVLAERRRELGLLLAVGARPGRVARMVLIEAGLTTGAGGVGGLLLGAVLLLALRHVLADALDAAQAPFAWPDAGVVAGTAAACVLLAAAVGPLGALVPAWRACREDPYELTKGAGA